MPRRKVWAPQPHYVILDSRCTGSLSEKVTPRSGQHRRWWISSNTVEMIIDSLEKAGLEKKWCTEANRKLKHAKRCLKTGYRVHCKPEEATCPDHCRKFALSNKQDFNFQEICSHQHSETCGYCENLKNVLDEAEVQIRGFSWHPYSKDTSRRSSLGLQAGPHKYISVESLTSSDH